MDKYKGIQSRRIRICPHCGNEAPQRLAFHHCPNLDAGARKKKKGKIEVYWVAVCDTCNEFSIWGDEVFGGLVAWHSRENFLVYPSQPLVHSAIPDKVSRIYDEAKRIVNLAPNAFSVQIRRALEAICEDKGCFCQSKRGPFDHRKGSHFADSPELLITEKGTTRSKRSQAGVGSPPLGAPSS
jgi:hypothetical protein